MFRSESGIVHCLNYCVIVKVYIYIYIYIYTHTHTHFTNVAAGRGLDIHDLNK